MTARGLDAVSACLATLRPSLVEITQLKPQLVVHDSGLHHKPHPGT